MRRHGCVSLARSLLLAVCLAPSAAAQMQWSALPVVRGQSHHGIAWDGTRQRLIMVTTDTASFAETWEWDGNEWRRIATPTAPPTRSDFGLAYDGARQRVVLFGGLRSPNELNDTWEWDGTTWTQRFPANSPPPRTWLAMAYDTVRQRVVMFGGLADGGVINSELDDTWEWDGQSWTQRFPAHSPPPLRAHHMAYDAARGQVLMFGGYNRNTNGDTWSWDGTDWQHLQPATRPASRGDHGLTYDIARQRIVMFGGTSFRSDTWEWDGADWTQVSRESSPPGRQAHAMGYDRATGEVVVFGGLIASAVQASTETWLWNGTRWRSRGTKIPSGRVAAAVAYDSGRDRVVLFGGVGATSTWEWDGQSWHEYQPATYPFARSFPAMAYDSARQRTVLFGGSSGNLWGDTWEWDGRQWIRPPTTGFPPARSNHAMAYDPIRKRVVLFGGADSLGTAMGDTWEWDGAAWVQQSPGTVPPARQDAGLAFDPDRGHVLMFGGRRGGAVLQDMYEWTGSNWVRLTPATMPPAMDSIVMTYDSARQRVVMTGYQGDTWDWDGTDWTDRGPGPKADLFNGLAYHEGSGRSVALSLAGETWEYYTTAPASAEPFGSGCASSVGVPALSASGLPWNASAFALQLETLGSQPAFLVLGASRTTWAGFGLPLALGFAGMPGCEALVSFDLVVPLVNTGGTASWQINLNDPALVGASFHAQGGTVDPNANALGLALSNAVTARIGTR